MLFNEESVAFGVKGSRPEPKRDLKCIGSSADASVFVVGNDSDDLGVQNRWVRARELDHLLKTGPSALGIPARKNQNPYSSAFRIHNSPEVKHT